jgi:hypothetical protein
MKASSLISAVEGVLLQGCTLLKTVSPEVYTRRQDGPHGAPLGTHYRHVLDHFLCLLDGLQTGQVDYDQRQRSPEIENSSVEALFLTENLIQKFRNLPSDSFRRDCTVIYSVGYGEREAQAVRSNVAREVMFCVGHAIHHYAILKMLCMTMAVTLPYEFGIAPSPLKHLEMEAAH